MLQLKLYAALSVGFLLSACVIGGDSASATYRVGYSDGCAQRQDRELYAVDPDYRAGWLSGRASCAGGQS